MPLVEQEKVEIRHFLGYLNTGSVSTFFLGVPAAVETSFIIERAMDLVLEAALPKVRDIMAVLRKIECQKVGDMELLAVESLGDIKLRKEEQKQLNQEYLWWQGALANALGCYSNPFDKRDVLYGGVNVRVS